MIDVRDEGIVLTRKIYITSCSNLGLSWFIIIKPRNLSDRNWSISPCAHVSLHLSYSASIFLISDSKVEMHLARAVIPNMRPWVRMDSWIRNADVYLCLCRHSSANDILICLTILNQNVIWWRLQTIYIYRLKHPRSFLHFLSWELPLPEVRNPFVGMEQIPQDCSQRNDLAASSV